MLEAAGIADGPHKCPKGRRDRALLHVLFYTGCRVSEVTTFKVKNFFEDSGYWVLDFIVKGQAQPPGDPPGAATRPAGVFG